MNISGTIPTLEKWTMQGLIMRVESGSQDMIERFQSALRMEWIEVLTYRFGYIIYFYVKFRRR